MSSLVSRAATAITLLQRPDEPDKGATMVEYGLLVAFVALVVIGALIVLGPEVENLYTPVMPGL